MRVLAIVLCIVATPSWAQVYKCSEGGKTVFSDYPCQRTDNKTIDVRPAGGGPVNRSSEYWDEQQRRKDAEEAKRDAELEKENARDRKRLDAVTPDPAYVKALIAQRKREEKEAADAELKARKEREKQESAIASLRPAKSLSCWKAYFESADFTSLDILVSRFVGVESVAEATSRIQLAAPLLQLQGIREDIKRIKFSTPCLENLSANAIQYADLTLSSYKAFAAGGEVPIARVYADRYLENYKYGKELFKLTK